MKDGKCVKLFGTVQDIHEKKLQTLQLAESEERYRSLIDNTMYAVLLASEDCTIISSNPAAENMFQYASSELNGIEVSQLFVKAASGFIKNLITENPHHLIEWNGKKKSGELFSCKIGANTFTNSLGKQNLIITIKDNSAYKKIVVEHAIIEKRLQSILDNAPVAIYIKDMNGRYLMVNKEAEHIIQQPIEAIIGKKDIDLLPLEISKLLEKADTELVRTGKSFSYEETMPVAGVNSISQITKFLIKDDNGIATAIGAIAWDITKKRTQEQQILDAATLVQKLTEKVNIGIYQLRSDEDGKFHFDFLSKAFKNICPGVDLIAAKTNAKLLIDFIHPDDLQNVMDSTEYSRANLTDLRIEFRWVIDGKTKWIDASSKPERKPDGSTIWHGYMEDVTLHRQELERLRLMESVVTNMQDMVVITEAEPFELPGPKILYVNDAYTQITGFSREETVGYTPRKLQGFKSDRAVLDKLFTALKNWQTYTVEIINYRKDGKEFWNNFTVMPIADEKGWFTHWVSIQRDVTQTKEYIISIENKNKKLEEIAWTQSHVVRAPLTNLMALVNVLENYPKEDNVKLIKLIKETTDQLDKIIGDIIKMSADIKNIQ
jgi:PAS domain S-box-containing protein